MISDFSFANLVEILIFAFILFSFYRLVRGTPAMYIFGGVVAIYVLWKVADILNMALLSEVLGQFINVGIIAVIIVFQQEIRKFLLMLGSRGFGRRRRLLRQLLFLRQDEKSLEVDPIIHAVTQMNETKTGALIAIERKMPLGYYAQTGVALNAKVGSRLLQSIFFKDAPLHDGAVIITQDTIAAASAILPISESEDIPARYGLRHRAAVGLTEKTDSVCLVVSEESGQISIIVEGNIDIVKDKDELRRRLTELVKY